MEQEQTLRLDKWLKISRLAKTRTRAAELCEKRKIKVNNIIAKASKTVKTGDIITINKMGKYRKYKILGIANKSVSAKVARELYSEIKSGIIDPEPTKKERREMEKLKGL